MKVCFKCGIEKPLEDFGTNKSKKNGYQSRCKDCQKEYRRKHYIDNIDAYKKKARKNKLKVRQLIVDSKVGGCVRCGENHPSCLDFHHPDDNKELTIGGPGDHGYLRVKKEIEKCIVLCANCHRKHHYNTRNE